MIRILMKILIFLRGSAKEDAEAVLSLKEQEQACLEFARQAGYTVFAVFRERRGDESPDRPQLE